VVGNADNDMTLPQFVERIYGGRDALYTPHIAQSAHRTVRRRQPLTVRFAVAANLA
jgi:hypothetical protein